LGEGRQKFAKNKFYLPKNDGLTKHRGPGTFSISRKNCKSLQNFGEIQG